MPVTQAMKVEEVPLVPGFAVGALVNDYEPSLLWVFQGKARIQVARDHHPLSQGEAMWIPAGLTHTISVDEESIVFPIPVPVVDLPDVLKDVIRLTIPYGWEDWLILQFAHTRGYLCGSVVPSAGLIGLVAGSRDASSQGGALDIPRGLAPPALPRSDAALEVARVLLRNPRDATELSTFASRLLTGKRTLQRQFVEETGMPFTRWRTATRIAAAAAYLDTGRDVGWVGHEVGFVTPTGFTRAFTEHTGRTPSEYLRLRQTTSSVSPAIRSTLAQEVVTLSGHESNSDNKTLAPPIPMSSTWARVNDFHVMVWVYRGTARLNIGDRIWNLHRGDAMWLPAGVHSSIEIDEGSLLLPLGDRTGTSFFGSPPLRVIRFPIAAEKWLLHTVIANYTSLRPNVRVTADPLWRTMGHGPDTILSSTKSDFLQSDLVQKIITAVTNDPADSRMLSDWARESDINPGELQRLFLLATGERFSRWRSSVRVSLARQLLEGSMTPGEVARHVGYAHVSSFTQAFSKTYGVSPRAYQRRGIRLSDEQLVSSSR